VITTTQNMAAIQAIPTVHILVNSSTFLRFSPPGVPGTIVKTSFLQSHSALLQEYVKALIMGEREFASNESAWVAAAAGANPAMNASTLEAAYAGFSHGFAINGGINMTRAELGISYLYTTSEFVSQNVPVISAQQFVNTTLVDNVLKQLGVSSAFDGIGRTVASAATTTAIMAPSATVSQRQEDPPPASA
jgi:hypothetical protein